MYCNCNRIQFCFTGALTLLAFVGFVRRQSNLQIHILKYCTLGEDFIAVGS